MFFMRSRWAYLISFALLIISSVIFVLAIVYENSEYEDYSISYHEVISIDNSGYDIIKITLIPPTTTDLSYELVEMLDSESQVVDKIKVTYQGSDQFIIHITPQHPDLSYSLYLIGDEQSYDVDKNAEFEIGTIWLRGTGTFEFSIEHLNGTQNTTDLVIFDKAKQETSLDLGPRGALLATVSGLFGLMGIVFFFLVYSKRNQFKKKLKNQRLKLLGLKTKEDKISEIKKRVQTGKRRSLERKVNLHQSLKEPPSRNYYISLALFLIAILLTVLYLISVFSDRGESVFTLYLPNYIPIITLILFTMSFVIFFNTLSGRKAFAKDVILKKAYYEKLEQEKQNQDVLLEEQQSLEEDSIEDKEDS